MAWKLAELLHEYRYIGESWTETRYQKPKRAEMLYSLAQAMLMTERCGYAIAEPEGGWRNRDQISSEERRKLRPIAETLAMLDGNAFFGDTPPHDTWYEGYLPAASALYEANGGDDGWAGEASFIKRLK
jgi:hypothetical protein